MDDITMSDLKYWKDSMEEMESQAIADLDSAIDEIIRLQERVDVLERARQYPDNSFWGQLVFDVFAFVVVFWIITKVA